MLSLSFEYIARLKSLRASKSQKHTPYSKLLLIILPGLFHLHPLEKHSLQSTFERQVTSSIKQGCKYQNHI